jgi:hypothetical protein
MSATMKIKLTAILAFALIVPSGAQTTLTAFLPEVDSYFRFSPNVRLFFQAKGYMEDGDLDHAQIGPSLQFNMRPLEKLKTITIFDLDDIKCMPVVFTIGYRYLPSSAQADINRFQPIVLFHVPFPGRTLVTDRNRFDLDWSRTVLDWTYRNRITAERRLTIGSYHPGPYAAAEFAHQSQYSKWSNTRLFAGCLLPLSKHIQIDTYYEHVNNTATHPNHQVNAAGLLLNFYFPLTEVKRSGSNVTSGEPGNNASAGAGFSL